jgi:hypothetical protein
MLNLQFAVNGWYALNRKWLEKYFSTPIRIGRAPKKYVAMEVPVRKASSGL